MTAYYNENDPFAVEWLRNLINAKLIAGGDVDGRSIVDVQPEDLKGYTQCHFFAGIGGWSYALRLAGWPDDRPVWTGSCPCFPEGTLILTNRGLVPIEDVVVGDAVLTHKARFRRVQHVGSEISNCITLNGQGHFGLTVTPQHPFYAGEDRWVSANEMLGMRWANVIRVPPLPVPAVESLTRGYFFDKSINKFRVKGEKNGKPVHVGICETENEAIIARQQAIFNNSVNVRGANQIDVSSLEFAKFLGYWVGDGWVSGNSVFICGSRDEQNLINKIFSDAKLPGKAYLERTSARVRVGSRALVNWLKSEFGQYSHKKSIPSWLFGMPNEYKRSFLDGYWLADGHEELQGSDNSKILCFTTTSRALAVGVRILLNQMGRSASIRKVTNSRVAVIEGRIVNERPSYRIASYDRARSFRFDTAHGWGLVRKITQAETQKVYNLAVEEDESYTADGIVVHNCQPFSNAGKHRGAADERHLWPEFYRLIAQRKPSVIFGEQVASKDGREWLAGVRADLENVEYEVGAADLCAAGEGAPHIRQRLYWVADANCERRDRQHTLLQSRRSKSNYIETARSGAFGGVGRANSARLEGWGVNIDEYANQRTPWQTSQFVQCTDGKASRISIESESFPLAARLPNHVGRLRAYGNAIVPQTAATFIETFMEFEMSALNDNLFVGRHNE